MLTQIKHKHGLNNISS